MRTYRITMLNGFETIMKKNTDEMKRWIEKFNVTDKDGNKLNLAKIGSDAIAIKANGKFLRISR